MARALRLLTGIGALMVSLLPGLARAQFSKTITVTPGVPARAVTTWYYANCSASLGLGSFSIDVAPSHGTLSFSDVSGPLPGCPPGSPPLPAAAADYEWTDSSTLETTDSFQLTYSVDGITQVDNITVNLAAPPGGEPCNQILSSRTVVSVPLQPVSRSTIGVAEVVSLSTTYPAQWSVDGDGFLTEPANGACTQATDSTDVEGTEACFTAPYSAAQTTVTAQIEGGGSCSVTFDTIEPTGLVFQRLTPPGYAFKDNTNTGLINTAVIGYWSAYFLLPGTVSFANVGIVEQDKPAAQIKIAPAYPNQPLVAIPGAPPAWFWGCDFDVQPLVPTDSQASWVYTWGSTNYLEASTKHFAYTATKLFDPLDFWLFEKGQVTGNFPFFPALEPYIEPIASLAILDSAHKSVLQPLSRDSCLAVAEQQFQKNIIPVSK